MIAPRILILGSETHGLDFIRYLVAQTFLEGKVTATNSPREALERIQTDEYHVVMCDMDLPEAGGAVFLEESRGLWPRPTIVPLIRDHAMLPPAYGYMAFSCVRKPISFDTLSRVLLHAVEFNLLHRRVERFSRILRLMNDGKNVFAEQLRNRILEAEAGMRDLWEGERVERERTDAMDLEPSPSDCDAVLQDPNFGWAMETLLIHQDKRQGNRKSSKVA